MGKKRKCRMTEEERQIHEEAVKLRKWFKNALLIAEKQGKRTKRYVEGILQNWKRDGGMKLESDASVVNIANRPKPTRFHTAEQRTAKYTAEGLEEIARKRREGS